MTKRLPSWLREQEIRITQYETDIAQVKAHTPLDRDTFPTMQIGDYFYDE